MTGPIPVRVTRYRCPHCARSHSAIRRCREHIARCWRNPDAHGCLTCAHFEPAAEQCCGMPDVNQCWPPACADVADRCRVDVDLSGRPAGDGGAEVNPGPIVGCPKWQPTPSEESRA